MVELEIKTVAQMHTLGQALGCLALGGDLLMLNGPLGAGKTTLTQGIAKGLGITSKVSSPTFVISQYYRGPRIDLVHVDAYRLESLEDLDALDLDTSLEVALTVVEWGAGKVEVLAPERLELDIIRPEGSEAGLDPEDLYGDAPRIVRMHGLGERGEAYLQAVLAQVLEN